MKFIVDKEISLANQDLLSALSYADTLKEIVLNTPNDTAFTIGLFGEWGSGKSSIIKTVEENFEKTTSPKIKFIVYDAWKYANDSFRRMFLFKVQQELNHEKNGTFEAFYRSKNSDVKIDRKIDTKYIIGTIVLLLVGIGLIYLINDRDTDLKITITLIISFLGVMINVIGRAFSDYKVTVQEPLIFAPEQFEECFDEMIMLSLQKDSKWLSVKKWVTGNNYVSGLDKIVIVIDNIDRCPKDLAYELITNIKNFLGKKQRLVFLVPVDDEALKRHLEKGGESSNKEAEEFLRKFFNITLRIKPFKRFDLYDFTNTLNQNHKLNLNPTTIDIISKEYATNPRRIIQFFNNLISELQLFKINHGDDYIKKNESLICKMLLLREEWPTYYKRISHNPNLLNNPDEITIKYSHEFPDLDAFLNVTESINKNENFDIIESILSTSDRSSKISSELMGAIQKKNFEIIKASIEDGKTEAEKVIEILIEKINTGVKRQTYQTDVNNLFEVVCWINGVKKIGIDENRRIYNELKFSLDKVLPHISDFDLVCQYSNSVVKEGLNYLENWIIDYSNIGITNDDETLHNVGRKVFWAYIKNQPVPEKIVPHVALVLRDYVKTNSRIEEYGLNDIQLRAITNDAMINLILEKLENLQESDLFYRDLIYISHKIKFTSTEFNALVEKINLLYPNFTNRTIEQLIEIILNINQVFISQVSVLNSNSKANLEELLRKLLEVRNIRGSSNFLIDETSDVNHLKAIYNLLLSIYKISFESINIQEHFEKIISKLGYENSSVMNELAYLKNSLGFRLLPMRKIIFSDERIDSVSLELNEFMMLKQVDEVTEEEIKDRLRKYIDAYCKDQEIILKEFLDKISDGNRVRIILTSIIIDLEREKILKLSNKLQALVFDKISEGDNIFDYQNNTEFLHAMAQNGSSLNISAIVRLVINKLTKKETLEEAVDILSYIREVKPIDKRKMDSIINDLDDDDLKKRAKSFLDRI